MTKDAEITAVYGSRGSGKSTMARDLVKGHDRVLVLDPTLDWQNEGPYQPVNNIGDLAKMLKASWRRKKFRIVYNIEAGRMPECLHHVSQLLFQYQDGYKNFKHEREITLVVEEMASAYGNAHVNRRDLRGFPAMILQGRHYGVNVIGISQRPADIAAQFRSNARSTYVYRLNDHNCRKAIEAMTGPQQREAIRTLAEYRHLHIRDGIVSEGKLNFRKRRK